MIKDISCKVLIFSVTSNNKQKIRHFQILYLSQAIVNIKYVVCALILKNPSIVSKKRPDNWLENIIYSYLNKNLRI